MKMFLAIFCPIGTLFLLSALNYYLLHKPDDSNLNYQKTKEESSPSKPSNAVNLVEAKPFGIDLGYAGRDFIKDTINKLPDNKLLDKRPEITYYKYKEGFYQLKIVPPKPDNFWTSYEVIYSPSSYAIVSIVAKRDTIKNVKFLNKMANKMAEKYHLTGKYYAKTALDFIPTDGKQKLDFCTFESKNCNIFLEYGYPSLTLSYNLKDKFFHRILDEHEKHNRALDEKKSKELDAAMDTALDSIDF